MVYSDVILQSIRDIRLNGRNVLTVQNQIRAGKIFKCTIFVGYGGVIFFTGVAPDGSKVRRVYDVARKR